MGPLEAQSATQKAKTEKAIKAVLAIFAALPDAVITDPQEILLADGAVKLIVDPLQDDVRFTFFERDDGTGEYDHLNPTATFTLLDIIGKRFKKRKKTK